MPPTKTPKPRTKTIADPPEQLEAQTLEVPAGSVVLTPEAIQEMTDSIAERVRAELDSAPRAAVTNHFAAPPATGEVAGPSDAEIQLAAERNQRIRDLMPARAHLEECPAADSNLGRIEAYEARRPPRPAQGEPAKTLTVVRCVECGNTRALDGPLITHGL